jgi:hypothetical protein
MTKPVAKKTTPPAAKPQDDILAALEKIDADAAKLTEARTKLVAGAKAALLAKGEQIIVQLRGLGFSYKFSTTVSPEKPKSHKKGAGQAINHTPRGICPVCHYSTQPNHDGRSHRRQETKGPFTATELAERGLTRI